MEFSQIIQRAKEIREKYAELEVKRYGKKWTSAQIAQGLVGDIGDLMKLVTAKEGVRTIDNLDEKLAHELSDCLWSIIVMADQYNIDIEKSFLETMDHLEENIKKNLS